MPLILSIVLGISYVRRTRIKLHFRIQYVFHKSKKQTSEMQRLCTSFFSGLLQIQISLKQSSKTRDKRLENKLCFLQIGLDALLFNLSRHIPSNRELQNIPTLHYREYASMKTKIRGSKILSRLQYP